MTWRSKSKEEGMPWAMPRRAWSGYDFGGNHFRQMTGIFKDKQDRSWQWPAMHIHLGTLKFEEPVRHGSYGNCLTAHNLVLSKAGVGGDYTLHSPRFYVPGLAGQIGMTLEQRRTLGHWGPNSSMPVRYDQARCCTELKMKADLWRQLENGFEPAADFHIPAASELHEAATEMTRQRQEWTDAKNTEAENPDDSTKIIVNHKSMVVHRADPEEETKSACQYAHTGKPHLEAVTEVTARLTKYVRCMAPACFGRPETRLPVWDKSPGSSDDESASGNTHAAI